MFLSHIVKQVVVQVVANSQGTYSIEGITLLQQTVEEICVYAGHFKATDSRSMMTFHYVSL